MRVFISGKEIFQLSIESLQITGSMDSLFNKGRILLNSNSLYSKQNANDSFFFVGAPVEILIDEGKTVYLKVLAFNFLQENLAESNTAGDLLELILVSSWFIGFPAQTLAYYGNAANIARTIAVREAKDITSSIIEDTGDPYRKRYQIGESCFSFLGKLRKFASKANSAAYLYSSLYDKKLNLRMFSSLKEQGKVSSIVAYNAPVELAEDERGVLFKKSRFYFNENKDIDAAYASSSLVKELQLHPNSDIPRLFEQESAVTSSLLTPTHKEIVKPQTWSMSPLEQFIVSAREKLVSEAEFNMSVIVVDGIVVDLELGSKFTFQLGKEDATREKLLSAEYIVKSLTISIEDDHLYTKVVAMPIIV